MKESKVKVKDRVRKVDVNKLDNQELENLEKALTDKIVEINDEACKKVNDILKIYGLRAMMGIQIMPEAEYEKLQKGKTT